MSLTGHLADPSSPIHGWFARRLPHTAPVVREANRALRLTDPMSSAPGVLRRTPGAAVDGD